MYSFSDFSSRQSFVGNVANPDRAEVRQPGLRTHRGKFRNVDLDFVAGKLIGPALNRGKVVIQPAGGVVWSVAKAGCTLDCGFFFFVAIRLF